jgi:hypothetical protein
MTNVQGDQAPAKLQKMLKKLKNSSVNTCQTIHELTGTILTENPQLAPSSRQYTWPHSLCLTMWKWMELLYMF